MGLHKDLLILYHDMVMVIMSISRSCCSMRCNFNVLFFIKLIICVHDYCV